MQDCRVSGGVTAWGRWAMQCVGGVSSGEPGNMGRVKGKPQTMQCGDGRRQVRCAQCAGGNPSRTCREEDAGV